MIDEEIYHLGKGGMVFCVSYSVSEILFDG